jgi:serine/threonine-protein kinase
MELYLQGRREYRGYFPPAQLRAVALYERALALAPGDGVVLTGLALSQVRLAMFGILPYERPRITAQQAIARVPNHAEAHLAMAMALREEHGAAAMSALRPALAMAPGLPEIQLLAGQILGEAGADDGLGWLSAAHAADPLLNLGRDTLIRFHAMRGQRAEADPLYDANLAVPGRPMGTSLWRYPLWFRDHGRALAAGARIIPFGDSSAAIYQGVIDVLEGRSGAALHVGLQASVKGFRSPAIYQMEAEFHLACGAAEPALVCLENADAGGLSDLAWVDGCPTLAPLRDAARFQAIRDHVQKRAGAVIAAFRAP